MGPARDVLAEQAALRADRAALAMTTAMDGLTTRIRSVITERLRGPRARKGTRYWKDDSKAARPANIEVKALDGDYIVPDSMIEEIDAAMRPVALRVALDAADDVATRLGPPLGGAPFDDGMFAVDQDLLGGLIDDALADLTGVAARYVTDMRTAILDGETDELDLDDLIDTVGAVAERGAKRLRLDARTLGTALAGSAALEQARALGATTTQWISRRDERVRISHRIADGQVRDIGDGFQVGRHVLEYPGDPSGLPVTAEEVMGCRCGLLFARPDSRIRDALVLTALAETGGTAASGVLSLFDALDDATDYVEVPDAGALGIPPFADEIRTAEPVVGWRILTVDGPDLRAGQRIGLPSGTALGLAAPALRGVATMSVLIPAGTRVGLSGGAVVLLDAADVAVVAVSAAGLQTAMF